MNIVIDRVSRHFQNQFAVQDVSLSLRAGSMVSLLGANGAGKSTLLRLLAGWIPVSSGRITIDDRLIKPTRPSARRLVMLLDEPPRNRVSVAAGISQAISDYDADRDGVESEVADWFEKLNLIGLYGKSAENVSKGQRFKIAMIGLFLVSPPVWLLDEPFSCGLDADGLRILEQQMCEHVRRGGLVVFSSQWPEHAVRMADQAVVLDQGKMVWNAPPVQRVDSKLVATASASLRAVLQGLHRDDS
ncbi:MAG: ABC transporter ATP-binding protein [Pirellulales bacterium]|nr:ABC transporter ATP-binding protein [Pirellulales bacterium]